MGLGLGLGSGSGSSSRFKAARLARGDERGRGVAQREAEVAVEVGRHRAARLVADVSRGYHPSYHARYYASWVEGVRLRAW